MLIEAGLGPARDRTAIAPLPGGLELKLNTGVTAAKALASGAVDGFWANRMGAEIAVRQGVGTIVLDCAEVTAAPRELRYRPSPRQRIT